MERRQAEPQRAVVGESGLEVSSHLPGELVHVMGMQRITRRSKVAVKYGSSFSWHRKLPRKAKKYWKNSMFERAVGDWPKVQQNRVNVWWNNGDGWHMEYHKGIRSKT